MPKQRTHSGAKDRFRVTPNGKVVHGRQNGNHLAEAKTSKRRRRLNRPDVLTGADALRVKRMLGLR